MGSQATLRRFCWLCLFLVACTPARRKVQTDVVRSISFDGNGGAFSFEQGDYQLTSAMEQRDSAWGVAIFPLLYWVTPRAYDPGALNRDAYRLEIWYAHHGWLDARFTGWEVIRMADRGRKHAGMVRIVGHIEPGEPSLVRSLDLLGLEGEQFADLASGIRRGGYLREGMRFDMESLDATRDLGLTTLHNVGYPYARASTQVEAHAEQHEVDVDLTIEPGTRAVIGEILVEGSESVPADILRDTLLIRPGELFDARRLKRSQQALFRLGTFGAVHVIPDTSDPTLDEVPVKVSVTDRLFQTLRLGGGLAFRGGVFTPRISASYRHSNLAHRLIRLQVNGSLGVGFRPILGEGITDVAPVYSAGVEISTPRLGHRTLGLIWSGSIEQDFQSGNYPYQDFKTRLALSWTPTSRFVMSSGPEFELYRFLDLDEQGLIAARILFGPEFENPQLLTQIRTLATLDLRDDPITTRHGAYLSLGYSQALPVWEWVTASDKPDFIYSEFSTDLRIYRRVKIRQSVLTSPLTLAARLFGRVLLPWEGNSYLPYQEKAFLGGAYSTRGFLADQVGPYDTICVSNSQGEDQRTHLAKGGWLGAQTSGEARYALTPAVQVAAFSDLALLSEKGSTYTGTSFRVGGGVGVRFSTPVGPFRIDIAARPLYPEDAGPVEVAGCLEPDVRIRSFDMFSALRPGHQLDPSDRTIPFALNIYLAIGEAF